MGTGVSAVQRTVADLKLPPSIRVEYGGTYKEQQKSFRDLTTAEEEALIDRIASSKPDIVWVGLSTPKQERWMSRYIGRLPAAVLIGVGAAFDMHAGLKPQAPRWIQRSGLEWLFRLATEPRRLWRRYLTNNPRFVWRLFLQLSGAVRYDIHTGTGNN